MSGYHRRISTVRTTGSGCRFVAHQFCSAGGTAVHAHPGSLGIGPQRSRFGRFCPCGRGLGGLLLFSIHLLYFRRRIRAATIITYQLSAFPRIMQRARTGRTLIIGYLCCHIRTLLPTVLLLFGQLFFVIPLAVIWDTNAMLPPLYPSALYSNTLYSHSFGYKESPATICIERPA